MVSLLEKLQEDFSKNHRRTDIVLILQDEQRLKVHSVVLSLFSDVFATQFNNRWSRSRQSGEPEQHIEIDCKTFPPLLMVLVITYMYNDTIPLALDNSDDLLIIADFYNIQELRTRCLDYLSSLTHSNVLRVLPIADNHKFSELKEQCLQFLDRMAPIILNNNLNIGQFCDLPKHLVIEIIERDTLAIHEDIVLDLLDKWVTHTSIVHEEDNLDIPFAWEEFVPHIRFTECSLETFTRIVVSQQILDASLTSLIQQFIVCKTPVPQTVHFNTRPRSIISENAICVQRFRKICQEVNWSCNKFEGDRISFMVNTPSGSSARLHGVQLFGDPNHAITVRVSVLDRHNITLVSSETHRKGTEFVVIFKSAVRMQNNSLYTVIVQTTVDLKTCYGDDGIENKIQYTKDGTKLAVRFIDFEMGEGMSNGTTKSRGQISGLFFL
ncbi:BTB/POZ domain-containing protein 1-like [Saccoglossus kowalevskii]|uniref:Uncharacterized protein LOC102803421 n=1 Tax=Saccoglossus kowalevskii TaxID=10224 RepID=A0ABM0MLA7_SACKO|nr:PREDICTED: uncharacterized protein LOC102803421 [Saccoglossus kowalevskii]